MSWCFLIAFYLIISININNGYKILGIFPSFSKSHYMIGNALMKGLAEKGHEVSVISPYNLEKPLINYREIFVDGIHKLREENILPWLSWSHADHYTMLIQMNKIGFLISNHTLNHKNVQKLLYNPVEKFDVIVMEIFLNEAILGIGHHMHTPIIGLSTFCSSKWSNDMVGTSAPPSYVPSPFLSFTNKMNFFQRCANTIFSIIGSLLFDYIYMPIQENIYDTVFPEPKPRLWQLRQNVSLVLLNTHFTLNYPNPYVPNMIEIGGIHLEKNISLPKHLQKFLDEATDGAIYFSMGTNIKSTDLSPTVRFGLIKIFSSMKQKILWKSDDNYSGNLSANILINHWFPQSAILQHPNIKIFITHGGLLGLTEAIYYAVPIIGIPVFGDQHLNVAKAVTDGYAISIELSQLNEYSLAQSITLMLNDQSYKKHVTDLSQKFRDQPIDPLRKAIYWVEYIARHKGAPFLRSSGQDLNIFQYYSLDVFCFLIIIISIVFFIVFNLIHFLMKLFIDKNGVKLKTR